MTKSNGENSWKFVRPRASSCIGKIDTLKLCSVKYEINSSIPIERYLRNRKNIN